MNERFSYVETYFDQLMENVGKDAVYGCDDYSCRLWNEQFLMIRERVLDPLPPLGTDPPFTRAVITEIAQFNTLRYIGSRNTIVFVEGSEGIDCVYGMKCGVGENNIRPVHHERGRKCINFLEQIARDCPLIVSQLLRQQPWGFEVMHEANFWVKTVPVPDELEMFTLLECHVRYTK